MGVLRWLRDGWVIFGVTLLFVLVLDGILGSLSPETPGWARIDPDVEAPDRRAADVYAAHDWSERYWEEHAEAKSMAWEPYVYWRRRPYRGSVIEVDEAGLRATRHGSAAPVETIWVFGGSAVWGTGVADEYTVPSQLAGLLERGGRPAQVVNFGESGYVSTQSLLTLQRALHERPEPDAVVFLGGANDVFSALQAGRAGWPQNEASRRAEFRMTAGLAHYLAGFPALLEGVQGLIKRTPPPPDPAALTEAVVGQIAFNARIAGALGREFGFKVLYFWQPTVFSKADRSVYETAVFQSSLMFHRELQVAADALVNDLPAIHSLSDVFDGDRESVFLDFVHLGPAGNARMADEIAVALSECTRSAGLCDK